MIEQLVKYIEEKGYKVRVGNFVPGKIGTITIMKGDAWFHWALSNTELNTLPDYIWYQEADRHMQEIENMIAKAKA